MPWRSQKYGTWVDKFVKSSLYRKLHLTPTRLDIAIWTIILWVVLLNKSEFLSVIPIWEKIEFVLSFPPSIGLKTSTSINNNVPVSILSSLFSPFVIKFVVALAFAIVSHVSLRIYSLYEPKGAGNIGTENKTKLDTLLRLLDERSGIKRIYDGKKFAPVIEQGYSEDVLSEVLSSNTLKILSIAGYENIGKGEKYSLLFDAIKQKSDLTTEVILLDPTKGQKTIDERIIQLSTHNPSYKSSDMKREIKKTIEKLKELKNEKKNSSMKIYTYNFHPIFRLIICDNCLFMNTYESDFHGHESPVYKIQKVSNNDSSELPRLSLYNTFLNYFEKIKKLSSEIKQ